MSRAMLEDLMTMAEVEATRVGKAIPKGPTRLDRAVEKKAAKREDERKLAAWALAVKIRDGYTDRYTGRKVKGTRLILDPDAAHAHHIEPRANVDTRYRVENGLCLSAATHDAVERNKLEIVGAKFFSVNGRTYTDATFKVTFKEIA